MPDEANKHHVVIVGGGFAGLGCAQKLADHDDVRVTLIDRNNYHQFQPLLYQVATSQLAGADIAHSLREVFADQDNVDVKLAEITGVDIDNRGRSPRKAARRGPATSWSSPRARSRTSSGHPAPPRTLFRSTRSTTPPVCARGSSACSSKSTAIRRWSPEAR